LETNVNSYSECIPFVTFKLWMTTSSVSVDSAVANNDSCKGDSDLCGAIRKSSKLVLLALVKALAMTFVIQTIIEIKLKNAGLNVKILGQHI